MTDFNTNFQDKLTAHRRNLHMIPEIDRTLPKTQEYLLGILSKYDCEITHVCGDGLCAFFDFAKDDAIGFRADMDALPVTEETGVSFASTHEGFMHACGHDGHMSMVLTLAEYLGSIKENCKQEDACEEMPAHNVLLIFQPAEETLGGAEEICKTGILDKYNVKAVFGIHMWPMQPAGKIATRPGALMPRSAEINMYINGVAAHGTSPYEGLDALYIGTDYVQNVYREHAKMIGAVPHFKNGEDGIEYIPAASPDQRTIIHIGLMESGYARNIVSDYTHLKGTIRAYDDETFSKLVDILEGQLENMESRYGCKTSFDRSEGYPPIINNHKLFEVIKPELEALGDDYVAMDMPLMISEDFSFYGLYKPAVFFLLGTGTGIPLHSTNFNFDESVLMQGFNLYKALCQHKDYTL